MAEVPFLQQFTLNKVPLRARTTAEYSFPLKGASTIAPTHTGVVVTTRSVLKTSNFSSSSYLTKQNLGSFTEWLLRFIFYFSTVNSISQSQRILPAKRFV